MKITKEHQGTRLDKFLFKVLNITHSLSAKLIRKKQITVNGKKCEISTRLEEGDEIKLPASIKLTEKEIKRGQAIISAKQMNDFKKSIIFENDDFFAINKPSGLATQGGSGIKLSVDDFLFQINPEFRLIHRLDKETSGLLIIAKSRLAATKLSSEFHERNVQKTYLAIVNGIPENDFGTIKTGLKKESFEIKIDSDGKESITHYKIVEKKGNFALIELKIETGRMHQIRVHLASIGCKIVGDAKYGDFLSEFAKKISPKMLLHSYSIILLESEIEAKLPNYFNLNFVLDK